MSTSKTFNAFKDAFLGMVDQDVTTERVREAAAYLAAPKNKASIKDRAEFTAMLAHPAFKAPDRVAEVYDAAVEGWSGRPIEASAIVPEGLNALPTDPALWDTYLAIVQDAVAGRLDALSITQRTAEMSGMTTSDFTDRLITAVNKYPGVTEAAKQALPNLITMDQLAAQPAGSLAREFHDLIVDNKFDLEVLDRDELGLSDLPTPLAYLNTRILQAHDLWHIVAGYDTTSLHEVAISAFQLAQFGHSYSAQFLPIPFGAASVGPRSGFKVVADTVFEAWRHGRETQPFMLIDWESEWNSSTESIRKSFDIQPYNSPYRADLIEKTEPLIKAIKMVTAPFRMIAQPFQRA